jgi:hypothetical protein
MLVFSLGVSDKDFSNLVLSTDNSKPEETEILIFEFKFLLDTKIVLVIDVFVSIVSSKAKEDLFDEINGKSVLELLLDCDASSLLQFVIISKIIIVENINFIFFI